MIEVTDIDAALRSGRLVSWIAAAKGVELDESDVRQASDTAAELVKLGMPLADSLDGALTTRFHAVTNGERAGDPLDR